MYVMLLPHCPRDFFILKTLLLLLIFKWRIKFIKRLGDFLIWLQWRRPRRTMLKLMLMHHMSRDLLAGLFIRFPFLKHVIWVEGLGMKRTLAPLKSSKYYSTYLRKVSFKKFVCKISLPGAGYDFYS